MSKVRDTLRTVNKDEYSTQLSDNIVKEIIQMFEVTRLHN